MNTTQVKNLRSDVLMSFVQFIFDIAEQNPEYLFLPKNYNDFLGSDVHDLLGKSLYSDKEAELVGAFWKAATNYYKDINLFLYGVPNITEESLLFNYCDLHIKHLYDSLYKKVSGKVQKNKIDKLCIDINDKNTTSTYIFIPKYFYTTTDINIYCKCGKSKKCNCNIKNNFAGIKEEDGKLIYEVDWSFIQKMAERMSENKSKYPRGNWKKPIDIQKLKDSMTRHFMSVVQDEYKDGSDEYGHILGVALNAMFLYYQLNNNND